MVQRKATTIGLLLSLATWRCAAGGEVGIRSWGDFSTFMDNVNTGKSSYSGTTIFLETDIINNPHHNPNRLEFELPILRNIRRTGTCDQQPHD